MHVVPKFGTSTLALFIQYLHKFTGEIHVPTDYDHSDTFEYTMITLSDSTIDIPMASSSGRVDIIPKSTTFGRSTLFFGMISTLPLELAIGTSMVLSKNVMLVYYKVSEPSKSVGTCISPVKLCKSCAK